MAKMIQVELIFEGKGFMSHVVQWVPADLKPKEGMKLQAKGDDRVWTVAHAYVNTPQEFESINTSWKVV